MATVVVDWADGVIRTYSADHIRYADVKGGVVLELFGPALPNTDGTDLEREHVASIPLAGVREWRTER